METKRTEWYVPVIVTRNSGSFKVTKEATINRDNLPEIIEDCLKTFTIDHVDRVDIETYVRGDNDKFYCVGSSNQFAN